MDDESPQLKQHQHRHGDGAGDGAGTARSSARLGSPIEVPSRACGGDTCTAQSPTPTYGIAETPKTAILNRASIELGHGHGRTMSGADVARKAKRFSMTFPINATAMADSRTSSPIRQTPPTPMAMSEGVALPTGGPTDSSFLTAVAAQERRVLELKEELQKAEGELKRLKQEWALHEAQRKRHDVRRLQKLQPLNTSSAPSQYSTLEDDPDGSSAWMQQEMERRKALLNGTKSSTRTVFSGSRHARTLSLLSPTIPSPKPTAQRDFDARMRSPTAPERPTHPFRVPTDEVLPTEVAQTADANIDLGLPRDVLMKTGKQMATDFRDGLWTFIEDLRQATVGDEGINGTSTRTPGQLHHNGDQRTLRQQPSRGSLARPQPLKRSSTTGSKRSHAPSPAQRMNDDAVLLDLGGSFWRENGLDDTKIEERPVTKKPSKRKLDTPKQTNNAAEDSLDGWDTWESPEAKSQAGRSNSDTSASDPRTSPSPGGTSPRTSDSSFRDGTQDVSSQQDRSKRDAIPWPALTKLAPGSLRRTASNLMSDWEKSLTPPADDKAKQTDYIGRAASPATSLPLSVKDKKAD